MPDKLLLIEDDVNLSNDLKKQFQLESFEVDTVYDGILANKLIQKNTYDCILLDINIPGINGYEVVKSIREKEINTPVIITTAFGELDDKLLGFSYGADDYITKPFFFKELLARVKVFLKRSQHYADKKIIIVADLILDLEKKQVKRANSLIKLTAREFELLRLLAEARGNPVSKKELLNKVWSSNFDVTSNTIEVFINLLRNKIDKNFPTKLIKTRIGFGYYLAID